MPNTNCKDTSTFRQFDWGPPASKSVDGIKDLLVYFFVIIFLALGVWVLLEAMPNKPANTHIASSTAKKVGGIAEAKSGDVKAKPQHYVQLGAFSDKASADEIFAQLKKYDFNPSMAVPDQQYELYRIFLGPFENEPKAENVAEKLSELEFPCFVIER